MTRSSPLTLTVHATSATLVVSGEVTAMALGGTMPASYAVTDKPLTMDLRTVTRLDTAGSLFLAEILKTSTPHPHILPAPDTHVMEMFRGVLATLLERPSSLAIPPHTSPSLYEELAHLGFRTVSTIKTALNFLSFLGRIVTALMRSIFHTTRLDWPAVAGVMFRTGVQALPIVGIMSFVIGIILGYQGAFQLTKFGAEIFTVDLLGVSILREVGVLMAAIMVAGRSGSAFAAQIGTMKLREEIDAMEVMGLSPLSALVIPRMIGLFVVMPLLVIYADFMGLLGGWVISLIQLDISTDMFIRQLHSAIELSTFWVGLVKAPIFGFLIALVGCYEGWQVSGSAESVGLRTTRAVVESIFLIVIFDGLFSIIFSLLEI